MRVHLRTSGNAGHIQQKARPQSRVPLTHAEQVRASEGYNPVVNLTGRVGDASSVQRYAAALERTPILHPTNPGQKVRTLAQLQQTYGNGFVQQVIQAKLAVNQSGGKDKQASLVAQVVARTSDPQAPREMGQCQSAKARIKEGLVQGRHSSGTYDVNIQRRIMIAGPRRLYRVKLPRRWNILISQLRAKFLRRYRRRFRIGGRSRYRLANRIIEDMADTTDELKFDNEKELLREIRKRLWTSYLMGKSQRGRRVRGKLRYAFGYPNRGRAKNCDRRVNAAATKYWEGPFGSKSSYWFRLSKRGQRNAYKALRKLFVRQRNPCARTLIHCDNLISLIHFLAFAESMGRKKFNQLVRKGTIQIFLYHHGFRYIEKKRGRPREAVSLRWVTPSRREDLLIGDHVYFHNHPAYDVLIQGTGSPWRLETAVLVDQRNGVDLFQGHGYRRGPVTEEKMKKDMRDSFILHVNKFNKLVSRLKSKSPRIRNQAKKERNRYKGIKKIGSEYRIKGTAFYKIDVDKPLIVPPVDEFPGLYHPDPKKRNQLFPVLRPVESE